MHLVSMLKKEYNKGRQNKQQKGDFKMKTTVCTRFLVLLLALCIVAAVFVSCDGRESIETDGIIKIQKSTYTTKLIRIKKDSFYSILRKKMSERGVK